MKKYVGITACPTGIAHTYMAAEKLEETAKETGNQIKVETQGSIGVENELTADDIREADAVVVAADTEVDLSRFDGKFYGGTGIAVATALLEADPVTQTIVEMAGGYLFATSISLGSTLAVVTDRTAAPSPRPPAGFWGQ